MSTTIGGIKIRFEKTEKQMAKDQKVNKLTVVSVIEKNFTSSARKGMSGYEIVTYQTEDGEIFKIKVKGVIWGEDSKIEPGQTTNYEHPTQPGEFLLKYRDHTKYSRRVDSSYEGGVYVHEDFVSEGCVVLGFGKTSDKILKDILMKLEDGVPVKAKLNVVDQRILPQIKLRPLIYELP